MLLNAIAPMRAQALRLGFRYRYPCGTEQTPERVEVTLCSHARIGVLQMLREVKNMVGFTIAATDGGIGFATDFYFDDKAWVIRYLVVETGTWLSDRKVLISPLAIGEPNWKFATFPARLTREQVRNSPEINTDKPVSRQHELEYSSFYGYPSYWGGNGLWGAACFPGAMLTSTDYLGSGADYLAVQVENERRAREAQHSGHDDQHLRSCKAVTGYHISAVDGEIGHLEGLLVDEESWAIRYLIVNTSNWWIGHLVLVAPSWIRDVSWLQKTITVDLTRQAIRESPPYDLAHLPDRPHETLLHAHFGHRGYWQSETPPPSAVRRASVDERAHR
jgi:hypothetical protein